MNIDKIQYKRKCGINDDENDDIQIGLFFYNIGYKYRPKKIKLFFYTNRPNLRAALPRRF
ncbi:hypothetical protein GCM10010992_10090 [Cloacibacterium rupense]|uniref:Uncharacterized protein n=1 Tax=Cloacibacterium rupense TaxID=517423 RepID=A0ABQ2NMV8_9FLAO|nr:hypothetical protein GCM10010992_10090 [Cloacibacterium rupense]